MLLERDKEKRQEDKKTERQKDRKTERQMDRWTDEQKMENVLHLVHSFRKIFFQ